MNTEDTTHESFGQIRFSRVTGQSRFYGSELESQHYISLEIHGSEIQRGITQDRNYPTRMITRLRMTANQFSELITSLNSGSGVPCTLEWYDKQKTTPLPETENRKEFVHRKFEDKMKEFSNKMKLDSSRVKELTEKKTLSKEDQKELMWMVDKIHQEVAINIPFYAQCFQETMNTVVVEAKKEVESAIQHKITTLGLEKLHEQNLVLGDGKQ